MKIELSGQLERITYTNDENGYTIARLCVKGQRDLVTIAGSLQSVNPGEILKLKGQWFNHPRYGEQFRFDSYQTIVPATAAGIQRYLGSGLIKGIGPVMAKRIVAVFGADSINIIENSVERLKEIDGIGEKRVEMIRNAWVEQKDIKEVMLFLQGNGVSSTYAAKIFKRYGKESIQIVRDNPYRLAHDIFGIGFITADKIAQNLGIEKNSVIRAQAGIIYVLHQVSDEGHVYYPYEPLIEKCEKMLEIEKETVLKALAEIAFEKMIIIEDIDESDISANNKAVYLAKYHVSETGVAEKLFRLYRMPVNLPQFDKDKAVAFIEKELGINLALNQARAVKDSVANKVIVITGGPGTGKTTIIKAIIRIFKKLRMKVVLTAPTGRAAKRMTEATGEEAKTIHRLLEFSPKDGEFKKNERFPLSANLVVIDEASMVDNIIMHHFLKAVPLNATLILVGDVDQLPSVGAGNVLRDIIDSGIIPVVRLDEIFRQEKESLIIVNAHRINNGNMPVVRNDAFLLQDFYFLEKDDPEEILKKVLELCRERIPKKFNCDPIRDIQVITPMHKGIIGAGNLNVELQKCLNFSCESLERGARVLKTGDKVMQIVNNYDKEVFNGDIGIIVRIEGEAQEIVIDFDGRRVPYDFNDLNEIVLAYAVSVHKSQGSEYPYVVMPVHTQHYMLLQRNLLYTGVTRGKKLVILVGTKKALAIAIRNNKTEKRYTYLKRRLEKTQVDIK